MPAPKRAARARSRLSQMSERDIRINSAFHEAYITANAVASLSAALSSGLRENTVEASDVYEHMHILHCRLCQVINELQTAVGVVLV